MTRPPSPGLLARGALALYPPSWRARYGDEVRALLEDSGGGLAAVASVAWRALPAWFWPPRHLHDRPARMRASLTTVLMSWSMLAGLGLVFAQLTQLQGLMAPGYAEVRWAYAVFDGSLALSALVAGLGGLPLWLLMLRRARREQRARDTLYLLLPVLAPVAVIDKENGKPHVVKRLDRPRVRVIPEWFGGGALPRKELHEAAAELTADQAGLLVVSGACAWPGSPLIRPGSG